ERADVPRLSLLQPLGHVLDDRNEHRERRREQQRSGQQEDSGRVVGERPLAVAPSPWRHYDEELRERGADAKEGEGEPAGPLGRDASDKRSGRGERRRSNEEVEGEASLRQLSLGRLRE